MKTLIAIIALCASALCQTTDRFVGPSVFGVSVTPYSVANTGAFASVAASSTMPTSEQITTSATASSGAGAEYNAGGTVMAGIGAFSARIKLGSTALERVWVGMSTGPFDAGTLVTDTPLLPLLGFRYSTVAGDSNWKCVTANGVGGQNTVDSTVAADTNSHKLGFSVATGGGSVSFFIDGVAVCGTIATSLPPSSSVIGPVAHIDNAAAANAKVLTVAYELWTGTL